LIFVEVGMMSFTFHSNRLGSAHQTQEPVASMRRCD
jgi:hypothetical protein